MFCRRSAAQHQQQHILGSLVTSPLGAEFAAAVACRYVLSTDKRLLHLKQYSHSPVTWFRNPATHLVLVRHSTTQHNTAQHSTALHTT
jgi:hypothetical protein